MSIGCKQGVVVGVGWLVLGLVACRPAAEAFPTLDAPQVPASERLQPGLRTIRAEVLARDIEVLASDAFGGRFPGTTGETRTLAYVTSSLAAAGVRPAIDGSFLQPVPLIGVRAIPDRLRVEASTGSSWDAGADVLVGPVRGVETLSLHEREVVFAGYGIVAPEYGWDDYGEFDVEGKVVVVLGGEPPADPADPGRFAGPALSVHGTSLAKAKVAGERGAAAILTVYDPGLGISWEVLARNGSATKYKLAQDPRAPAVAASGLVTPALMRRLVGGDDVWERWLEEAKVPSFRARRPASGSTLTIEGAFEARPIESHNVVGIIEGAEHPEEVVIYTAHWDHVGTAESGEGDRIHNGAVDNATGTAALLGLARAYAALSRPPARSVVFLATTAEEQGLLGAWHYVQDPVFDLANTVGVINMDALFPFGATKGITVVAAGSSELEAYVERASVAVGRRAYPDPNPEQGAFFRSDHYPFADQGVPAIFAVGGPALDPEAGETVDLARFTDYVTHRYHQPADEYDPRTWDMAGIVQDVETFFRAGYELAESRHFPNWVPGNEFRARRDRMLRAASGSRDPSNVPG